MRENPDNPGVPDRSRVEAILKEARERVRKERSAGRHIQADPISQEKVDAILNAARQAVQKGKEKPPTDRSVWREGTLKDLTTKTAADLRLEREKKRAERAAATAAEAEQAKSVETDTPAPKLWTREEVAKEFNEGQARRNVELHEALVQAGANPPPLPTEKEMEVIRKNARRYNAERVMTKEETEATLAELERDFPQRRARGLGRAREVAAKYDQGNRVERQKKAFDEIKSKRADLAARIESAEGQRPIEQFKSYTDKEGKVQAGEHPPYILNDWGLRKYREVKSWLGITGAEQQKIPPQIGRARPKDRPAMFGNFINVRKTEPQSDTTLPSRANDSENRDAASMRGPQPDKDGNYFPEAVSAPSVPESVAKGTSDPYTRPERLTEPVPPQEVAATTEPRSELEKDVARVDALTAETEEQMAASEAARRVEGRRAIPPEVPPDRDYRPRLSNPFSYWLDWRKGPGTVSSPLSGYRPLDPVDFKMLNEWVRRSERNDDIREEAKDRVLEEEANRRGWRGVRVMNDAEWKYMIERAEEIEKDLIENKKRYDAMNWWQRRTTDLNRFMNWPAGGIQ